jgi:hypothetical protein
VARRHDRAGLEGVVTQVLIENLDVLVSSLGEREKLRRLIAAADLLIARRAPVGPGRTAGCERGDRA